jgi:hypothetical protein
MVSNIFYCLACFYFIYIAWTYTKILNVMISETSVLKRPVGLALDAEDFDCLVRGGVLQVAVHRDGRNCLVRVILKDIGFDMMAKCLSDACDGKNIHKDRNKIIN